MDQGEKEKRFTEAYMDNYQMVYRICLMYMKNIHDAEDSLQDVFVRLDSHEEVMDSQEHIKAWLITVSANICKDKLKSWWRKSVTDYQDYMNIGTVPENKYLLDMVMDLPAKYREVIYLHYYEGYNSTEIAKMLKMKDSTVRSNLMQARRMLKIELEK